MDVLFNPTSPTICITRQQLVSEKYHGSTILSWIYIVDILNWYNITSYQASHQLVSQKCLCLLFWISLPFQLGFFRFEKQSLLKLWSWWRILSYINLLVAYLSQAELSLAQFHPSLFCNVMLCVMMTYVMTSYVMMSYVIISYVMISLLCHMS